MEQLETGTRTWITIELKTERKAVELIPHCQCAGCTEMCYLREISGTNNEKEAQNGLRIQIALICSIRDTPQAI
jgi:hypothetical protein